MKEFILSCLRGFLGIKPPKSLTDEQREIENEIDRITSEIDAVKHTIRRKGGRQAHGEYFHQWRESSAHLETLKRILERQKQD